MIVLNLLCDNGHRFEAWFASRDAFDTQCGHGQVQCVVCNSIGISALPSGPHVRRSHDAAPAARTEVMRPEQEVAQQLFRALATMARQAENVGDRFPEEARRIHHDEAPARSIRGVATHEETRELLDEGILVLPAPVPPDSETH